MLLESPTRRRRPSHSSRTEAMFTTLAAQENQQSAPADKILQLLSGMAPQGAALPAGWSPGSTGVPGVSGGRLLADIGYDKMTDGGYTATRDLGDKYEIGLFDQTGNLVTSKVYDRDQSMEWAAKLTETLAPLAVGAGFGAGLLGVGAGAAGAGGASGATNAALIESAIGSTGYGASSAGLGGAAGLGAGASYIPANAAGAVGGVGAPTSTAGFQLGQMAGGLVPAGAGAAGSGA